MRHCAWGVLVRVKKMGQGTGNETSLFSLQSEFRNLAVRRSPTQSTNGGFIFSTLIYACLLIGGEENIFYMLIFIYDMQIVYM